MDFLARQKQLFSRNKLDDVFPVKSQEENSGLFFVAGDSETSYLAKCWMCAPVSAVSEQAAFNLKELMSNDYPTDTIISSHLVSTTYIDHHLKTFYEQRMQVMSDTENVHRAEITRSFVQKRLELFKKGKVTPLDTTTKVLLKDFSLFVTVKIPVSKNPTEDEFQKVSTLATALESTLGSLNVSPSAMSAQDYLVITRLMINPTEFPLVQVDENKELSEQIFDFDSYIEPGLNEVKVNDLYFRSMSIQQYPEHQLLPHVSNLIGDVRGTDNQIKTPFVLSCHMHLPSHLNEKEKHKKKAGALKQQADGRFGRKFPSIQRKSENFTVLMDSLTNGNRPVNIWTNLMLTSDSIEELNSQSNRIASFYEYNSYILKTDKHIQGPCFQSQFLMSVVPDSVKLTHKYCSMTSEHACQLIPIIADWKGNGDGANNLFYTKRGQVVMYDPFDSNTSSNGTIFGITGGGKSVVCNDICMGLYTRGAMVRIIDSGGSYLNATDNMGGEYIDFTEDSNIKINPFSSIVDIKSQYSMLKTILEFMCAPKNGLTDLQLSQLEKFTLEAFAEYGQSLDITTLSDYITSNSTKGSPEHDMGLQFFPYTRHGTYGKYFLGKSNLSMSGDWSCLELDGLQNHPELRMIVLIMMIMKLKEDFIGASRNRRGIFLIDEFWKFANLSDSKTVPDPGTLKVLQFIEEAFRVFRKHNKSCFISTQQMSDLGPRSPMIQNSESIILTKQRNESIDYMQREKLLSISPWEFDMLKTLKRKGSEYSDIFIYTTDRGSGFLRFVLDKFTQLMYSSNADEVERIKFYREEKGMTLTQAIESVIKDLEQPKVGA